MDHGDIPDPIAERLETQEKLILELRKRLDELQGNRPDKPGGRIVQ